MGLTSEAMPSVGILGGTFNPVHNGHLRLAVEVGEALGLERVLLTPCASPPHKTHDGLLPFALREAFLREAVRGIPLLEVSPSLVLVKEAIPSAMSVNSLSVGGIAVIAETGFFSSGSVAVPFANVKV